MGRGAKILIYETRSHRRVGIIGRMPVEGWGKGVAAPCKTSPLSDRRKRSRIALPIVPGAALPRTPPGSQQGLNANVYPRLQTWGTCDCPTKPRRREMPLTGVNRHGETSDAHRKLFMRERGLRG